MDLAILKAFHILSACASANRLWSRSVPRGRPGEWQVPAGFSGSGRWLRRPRPSQWPAGSGRGGAADEFLHPAPYVRARISTVSILSAASGNQRSVPEARLKE